MNVTASRGKIIVRDGDHTVLAAGEITNGRALVRVPQDFAEHIRRGFEGHVAMVDASGLASAPPAAQAKKLLKAMGIDPDLIKQAFGHLR